MTKNKTTENSGSVTGFINEVEDQQKRQDSYRLIELMQDVSGQPAKMWGPSIVGFGRYHYRYDSGHQGDAPLIGFSPRKAAMSLYVFTGLQEHKYLLDNLGKFKMGKACIYVRKLSDINEQALTTLMRETISYLTLSFPPGSAEGK